MVALLLHPMTVVVPEATPTTPARILPSLLSYPLMVPAVRTLLMVAPLTHLKGAAKRLCPKVKIVILSGEAGGAAVKQLMDKGINGYMGKNIQPEELSVVLATVMQGNNYTAQENMHLQGGIKADMEILSTLTRREMEIITLCASGMSAKQIADELCITPHTVENHKDSIFNKLNVKSTSELILFAFRVGLIS